ncbi:hypothetical protein AAFF_G00390580 [Aldrovandia affinis]|uniref:Uncharacterized protein n=1 Tax=Aldrovandia affinis TaxID=143900 RepID=A0AAD7SEJ7_9TELE|nr:hypothetical protein AAFF_G00390580 [Aldrovandia affinis]
MTDESSVVSKSHSRASAGAVSPPRITEAAGFKDHKIQVASFLISLKVEPSPALSVNLSGAPLIKIVLTHLLGATFPAIVRCSRPACPQLRGVAPRPSALRGERVLRLDQLSRLLSELARRVTGFV